VKAWPARPVPLATLAAACLLLGHSSRGEAAAANKGSRPSKASAPVADLAVKTTVTPSPATIGDRVICVIAFTTPPAMRMTPVVTATRMTDWDILGVRIEESRPAADGLTEQRFSVVLVPWSQTLTATPEFAFTATTPPGRVESVTVPPVAIKMASVLAKVKQADDLRPLKGVIGYRSWWWLILALAAIVLAAGAWWLWKRWKRRGAGPGGIPAAPPEPAETTARRALEILLAKNLVEQGMVKLFYIELSDIARRYIEGRFRIPALDLTTAELLPELRRISEVRPLYADIRSFLDDSDLVKFAKYVPDAVSAGADVDRVRLIIDRTVPSASPSVSPPASPPSMEAS
jgi:hypothetical protein